MTFWEQAAQTRWGSYMTSVESRAILAGEKLAGLMGHALEIGCEGGRWSRLLAARGWRMTCIDVDATALDACQQSLPEARCILADPSDRAIPCETGAFSLLLCIEVPPVIHSDWFLREADRVLTENGVLVAVTWNTASFRGMITRARHGAERKGRPVVYQTAYRKWRRGLGLHGFRIVQEEGFCWAPFGRSSNSRWIPIFTRLERLLGLNRIVSASPWIVFVAQKSSQKSGSAEPRRSHAESQRRGEEQGALNP